MNKNIPFNIAQTVYLKNGQRGLVLGFRKDYAFPAKPGTVPGNYRMVQLESNEEVWVHVDEICAHTFTVSVNKDLNNRNSWCW